MVVVVDLLQDEVLCGCFDNERVMDTAAAAAACLDV